MTAISASMKTFLESDRFEDTVRHARVFNSVFIDSIKEAMGRYCLDEGIGIFDKNRASNLQTANDDVAHSKDSRLQELVNSKSTRIPMGGVKR